MKTCQEHWDKLRKNIDDKGMSHLVAKNSDEAVDNLIAEASGEGTLANFDPLMTANNMISMRAMDVLGLYVLGLNENNDHYCPLCEVEKLQEDIADNWIDGCTTFLRETCEKNKMLSVNDKK